MLPVTAIDTFDRRFDDPPRLNRLDLVILHAGELADAKHFKSAIDGHGDHAPPLGNYTWIKPAEVDTSGRIANKNPAFTRGYL